MLLEAGQREIAIRTPMQPGPPPDAIYHAAAAKLVTELDRGNDASIQLKSFISLRR
jgi:hypothetical protein